MRNPERVFLGLWVLFCAAVGSNLPADERDAREAAALGDEPLLALPLSEAPGATTVITADEIASSGAANVFDLLRRVPGIDIRYTPMGGHIGIRSAGASPFSEQVLMLIDGSPYNSPDKGGFPGHPNYTGFFPLDRIARIEIIKGPISVLYGANAFAGVINIVSKRAADAVTDRIEGSAVGAAITAGSRGTFERRARFELLRDGWEATLEAGAADGDTPIRLNRDAGHSRNDVFAAVQRGNFRGSLLHQESRYGSFPFEDTTTRPTSNNVDIVDVHYERRVGSFAVRASGTVNRYRGTTCANCHNNQSLEPDNAVTDDVAGERETDRRIRLSLRADRAMTERQDLTFGLVTSRDTVERRIVRQAGSPDELDSGGLYVQHQWHLRGRGLHLISGVRFDTEERLGHVTSPRVALVAEPSEQLVVRGSFSRAYRSPTWNERFIRQRFDPEELAPGLILVFQGNPELEHERNDSLEAGCSWRLHPRALMKIDIYRNRLTGFIRRGESQFIGGSPNEIQVVYENRPDAFTTRGGELTVLGRLPADLTVTAGLAYRDVDLAHDDPEAAYAPRTRAILTAAWSPGTRWTVDVAATRSSSYTVSAPQVFGVRQQPPYTLVDAAVRYGFPAHKGRISLGLIGRNAFDAHPRETLIDEGVDTSLRGRVLALEARVDF